MVLLQESRGRMLTCQPPSLLLPPASHQAPTSGQADLGWLRHLGCWRRIAPFLRLLSFWRHGQGNSLAIVHTNHQGTSRLAPRPRSLQAVPKRRRTRPARRVRAGGDRLTPRGCCERQDTRDSADATPRSSRGSKYTRGSPS